LPVGGFGIPEEGGLLRSNLVVSDPLARRRDFFSPLGASPKEPLVFFRSHEAEAEWASGLLHLPTAWLPANSPGRFPCFSRVRGGQPFPPPVCISLVLEAAP